MGTKNRYVTSQKYIRWDSRRRKLFLQLPNLFPGLSTNRIGLQSRQASSNSGEGNNRESSLDDSGVVDDHEPEGDATSEEVASQLLPAIRVRNHLVIIIDCNVSLKNSLKLVKEDYTHKVINNFYQLFIYKCT